MLYQLDMDLGLLSNLTWETNASLLSMCTPSTVSMAHAFDIILLRVYVFVVFIIIYRRTESNNCKLRVFLEFANF